MAVGDGIAVGDGMAVGDGVATAGDGVAHHVAALEPLTIRLPSARTPPASASAAIKTTPFGKICGTISGKLNRPLASAVGDTVTVSQRRDSPSRKVSFTALLAGKPV